MNPRSAEQEPNSQNNEDSPFYANLTYEVLCDHTVCSGDIDIHSRAKSIKELNATPYTIQFIIEHINIGATE